MNKNLLRGCVVTLVFGSLSLCALSSVGFVIVMQGVFS